jgi:hypothetical protein
MRKIDPYLTKRSKNLVGFKFGESLQLEVIYIDTECSGNNQRRAVVFCAICAKDTELFGDGVFRMSTKDIKNGKTVCGCASKPRWTRSQYETRIKRTGDVVGYSFVKWTSDFKSLKSRVILECKAKNHIWDTSLGNLLKGTACKKCLSERMSNDKHKITHLHVIDFMSTGKFKLGTVFTRGLKQSEWKVYCPCCSKNTDDLFTSNTPRLKKGNCPCYCAPNSGFDSSKDSILYVIRIISDSVDFTGYGITGCWENRLKRHRKNLIEKGFSISEFEVFDIPGNIAYSLEKSIKRNFPLFAQDVSGFMLESTYYWLYDDVINFVEAHLE